MSIPQANAEIIMLDGLTCLYKSSVDLFFYVVGSGQENELLLMSVLDCLFNSCSGILRKNVDKKSLCDNMEIIMLALDEMIDGGMILESDPQQVLNCLHSLTFLAWVVRLQIEWAVFRIVCTGSCNCERVVFHPAANMVSRNTSSY